MLAWMGDRYQLTCRAWKLKDHRREAGGVEVLGVQRCRSNLHDHRHEAGGVEVLRGSAL